MCVHQERGTKSFGGNGRFIKLGSKINKKNHVFYAKISGIDDVSEGTTVNELLQELCIVKLYIPKILRRTGELASKQVLELNAAKIRKAEVKKNVDVVMGDASQQDLISLIRSEVGKLSAQPQHKKIKKTAKRTAPCPELFPDNLLTNLSTKTCQSPYAEIWSQKTSSQERGQKTRKRTREWEKETDEEVT
ncbi:hypothetical protein OnM2_039086, partial [Erysiphe neolycopersici]